MLIVTKEEFCNKHIPFYFSVMLFLVQVTTPIRGPTTFLVKSTIFTEACMGHINPPFPAYGRYDQSVDGQRQKCFNHISSEL
jgi:hypothetical protein